VACHVPVAEHWCPLSRPQCASVPIVIKDESVACRDDIAPGKFSLRTPWQQIYPGTFAEGVLDIKIDWSSADIDSLDLSTLRRDWVVHSDDGAIDVDARMALTDDELDALLVAIWHVTGNDYSEARAGERAVLTVEVSNEPGADDENHVVVSVTNRGTSPAYKVVAHLKSKVKRLEGIKLSFGRIDRAETKRKTKTLGMAGETDEPNPTVVVEVTSSNAPPASASNTIRLKSKHARVVPPELSCSSPDKQVAPGQRIHIECEESNPGDAPIRGGLCQLAVSKVIPGSTECPADLPPHEKRKFELDPAVPADAKPGPLTVTLTMTAPGLPPAQQEIVIEVVELIEPPKLCKQSELTIEDFRKKQQRLRELVTAGRITQPESNDYLAEWWSCVRQH